MGNRTSGGSGMGSGSDMGGSSSGGSGMSGSSGGSSSGGSSGPHLHFEERTGRSVVTPYFDGVAYRMPKTSASKNCPHVPVAGDWNNDGKADLGFYERRWSGFFSQAVGSGLLNALLLVIVVDSVLLRFRLRRELRRRFPETDLSGTTFYAIVRALQIRFLRLPKPQVGIGAKLPERYR